MKAVKEERQATVHRVRDKRPKTLHSTVISLPDDE